MKANVGGVDRVVRILFGLGLLSLVFILPGAERWWGLIGLVPLFTGVFRVCPAYGIFGVNTCGVSGKQA